LLVDARHGVKPNDFQIMKMLDAAAVNYQIVLTKTDKLKAADREASIGRVLEQSKALIARHPEVLETSAVKGWGIGDLRARLAALVEG